MKLRDDHRWSDFFKVTIAAQIHLVAFLGAIAFFIVFWLSPSIQGLHFVACAAFAILGAFVMGTSAFYHFVSDGMEISKKLERRLEDLDHIAIYLFIAGTYTPFLLNAVNSAWKYPLLIAIWCQALFGILYTKLKPKLPSWIKGKTRLLDTALFLLMGWTLLVRAEEVGNNLSSSSLWLLGSGASAYTIGAMMYAFKKPNFVPGIFGHHELWHIAVLAGFALHFAMILSFY